MPAAQASTELTNRIDQLLKQREEHESAIAKIDETLTRVGSALGGGHGGHGGGSSGNVAAGSGARRRGRPPGSKNVRGGSTPAAPAASKPGRRGRRSRGSFELSGEQSVLNFIQGNKNPSTKDVNQHWKSEGRGGSADNTLSKLVREKKLKRANIEGQRGSTYAAA